MAASPLEVAVYEMGFAAAIVTKARQEAAGRRVVALRFRAGALHRLDRESLQQAIETIAHGTEVAGAELEFVPVPATLTCETCGFAGESTGGSGPCPACGEASPVVTGGDELELESVTVEPLETVEPVSSPPAGLG